eukprot:m.36467 g.36467  ORF g.36467 m.36467 type:complete len:446 (+) comp7577_c0_seq1:99-1436(+)
MGASGVLRFSAMAFFIAMTGAQSTHPSITAVLSQLQVNAADLVLAPPNGGSISVSMMAATVSSTQTAAGATSTLVSAISTAVSTATVTDSRVSSMVQSLSTGAPLVSSLVNAVSTAASSLTAYHPTNVQVSTLQSTGAVTSGRQSSATSAAIAAIQSNIHYFPRPGVPKTCRDIIEQNRSAPSGLYMIQPAGVSAAFQVYCDHDNFGGGWTMVMKNNVGPFLSNRQPPLFNLPGGVNANLPAFYNMVLNGAQDVNTDKMTNASFDYIVTSPYWVASLNMQKTNAIAAFTKSKNQDPAIRVDFTRNQANVASAGPYMQQLVDAPVGFNYWAAFRNSLYWTNRTSGSYLVTNHQTVGYGKNFLLAKSPASWNPDRNTFFHESCQDRSFGVWGTGTATVGGVQYSMSRHGGLLGDGYCNTGNFWLMTLLPSDARTMNDQIRQSVVWLR